MTETATAKFLDRVFDQARLGQAADWLAVGVLAALPWSTSISEILIVIWLIALIPTLDLAMIRREVKSAAGGLPLLLWAFGAIGMLWAEIPWAERLAGLGGFNKLLVIPLLLAQFRRSGRGWFVLGGFLASCTVLVIVSFVLWAGSLQVSVKTVGIPIRDYIAQSTEALICAFALLGIAADARSGRKWRSAAALLAALFLLNILVVATGRTALIVIAALLLLFGFRVLGWKGVIAACVAAVVIGAIGWTVSPFLRVRVAQSIAEMHEFGASPDRPSRQRPEIWKKSVGFIATAPVIGHGTGSIPDQFRRAALAEGPDGLQGVNPHNQIFAVAIQIGLLGVVVLVAMWLAHLALFRGAGVVSWIGIVIVLQNLLSAPFNSHLFDSLHGWLYVFAFGTVGGMVQRAKTPEREPS